MRAICFASSLWCLGVIPSLIQTICAWFSQRAGMHVIDLDKTAVALEKALHMIRGVVEAKGTILFVNTRSQVHFERRHNFLMHGRFVSVKSRFIVAVAVLHVLRHCTYSHAHSHPVV